MGESTDTERRKAEVRRSFAARHRRQLCVVTPLLLLIVAVAALADEHTQAVLGVSPRVWVPPLFAALAGAAVYSFFNWRCPACNKYLGKQWNPRFCSKCGAPLR
jgi:hypothetical protein